MARSLYGRALRPRRKYKNESAISHDGRSFNSKLEKAVYELLLLRERAGDIKNIECQVHVYITDARILYIADFKCVDKDGHTLYVEAKGYESARWPMIKKLWKFYGPSRLEIWTGRYDNPQLDEEIVPRWNSKT